MEDRLVRAMRTESRYLRGGLRADLSAMLREHLAGRPPDRADDDAVNVAPAAYPDSPINLPGALPIEIRDPDTLYDEPPAGSASESLWFKRDWLSSHGLDPAQCLIVRVQGESMGNTLPDGCSALVDRGRQQRREGRIYALRTDRGLVVGAPPETAPAGGCWKAITPSGKPWHGPRTPKSSARSGGWRGASDRRTRKLSYTKRTFTRIAPPTVSTAPAGTRQVIRSACRSTTSESSTTNSGEVWINGSIR